MPGELTLAIDVGSSSLRVGRFDPAGTQIGDVVRRSYAHRTHAHTSGSFDAVPIADALRDALGEANSSGVQTVAISSMWHSVLAVDGNDQPLSGVWSWESTAPARELPALAARIDPDEYRATTGSYLHPSYPAAAIWMMIQEGVRPHRWTDLTGWLLRRVLGIDACWSREIAAGSGMWHQSDARWDSSVLGVLGIDQEELGEVWKQPIEVPRSSRLLPGTAVIPTYGDGVCNSAGIGAIGRTSSALTVGTSGSFRIVQRRQDAHVPYGLWRYQIDDDLPVVGAANSNAGNVLMWLAQLTGKGTLPSFSDAPPPPDDGLIVLPDLAGRRGPDYQWDARGAVLGLQLHHTSEDIARETVLATCSSFADLADLIRVYEPSLSEFIASGGVVTRSPAYAQLLADALGSDVKVSAIEESSLRGAALRVHDVLGREAPDPSIEFPVDAILTPREEWTEAIRSRSARAREIRARMRAQ